MWSVIAVTPCAVMSVCVADGKIDNNAMRVTKGIGFQSDIASFKWGVSIFNCLCAYVTHPSMTSHTHAYAYHKNHS